MTQRTTHDMTGGWPWRVIAVRSVAALAFTAAILALTRGAQPGTVLHFVGTTLIVNAIGVFLILGASSTRMAIAQVPVWLLCLGAFMLHATQLHVDADASELPTGALLAAMGIWTVPFVVCRLAARLYLQRPRQAR